MIYYFIMCDFLYLDTYQTSTSTSVYNNVHYKLWKGLTTLEHDIFPEVSATAQKLTKHIRQKVSNVRTKKKKLY